MVDQASRTLTFEEALALGMQHFSQGQLGMAQQVALQILAQVPEYPEALHLLGMVAFQSAEMEQAEQCFREILKRAPKHPGALGNLGNALREQGRLEAAEAQFKQALAIHPEIAEIHNSLGETYRLQGRHRQALSAYRQAIALHPGFALAHNNAGNMLKLLGEPLEAIDHYRQALGLLPDYAEALANLGQTLLELGEPEQARPYLEQALALRPDLARIQNSLGTLLYRQNRFHEALEHFQAAAQAQPDYIEAHNNLGLANVQLNRLPEALAALDQALLLDPGYADAHYNRADALRRMGRLDEALAAYERALRLKPQASHYHNNRANTLQDLGRLQEAMAGYQRAFELGAAPHYLKNLCNILLYLPNMDHDDLFEHLRSHIGQALERAREEGGPTSASPAQHDMPGAGGRRVRVGYLSSDFYDHPVGRNLLPLLLHHDRSRFELFCYAEVVRSDEITARIRRRIDHWRPTQGLRDTEVARQIRADGIDIMVYLAGLFDHNRFLVAAHRPAPVQVSFHNSATTALDMMDYWLTDALLHPAEATHERFTEQLMRLPLFYNYPPIEEAPDVNPLPADESGRITFVSFNDPAKINLEVMALWGEILRRLPGSRLLLKYRSHFGVASIQARLRGVLQQAGVDPGRLTWINRLDTHQEHLACYHQGDIALDPFPFTGATTTFQAMWMGVPVVTLLGERFISRMAGDIVVHGGIPELAVTSSEAYVDCAVALARDRPRLRGLRAELRGRLEKGVLCDGAGYARSVEAAFMKMLKRQRA